MLALFDEVAVEHSLKIRAGSEQPSVRPPATSRRFARALNNILSIGIVLA